MLKARRRCRARLQAAASASPSRTSTHISSPHSTLNEDQCPAAGRRRTVAVLVLRGLTVKPYIRRSGNLSLMVRVHINAWFGDVRFCACLPFPSRGELATNARGTNLPNPPFLLPRGFQWNQAFCRRTLPSGCARHPLEATGFCHPPSLPA